MTRIFITVLNMSFTASIAAAAVMLVRIPLRKVPKIFSYALWGVVFLRLICPFSPQSPVGLMPAGSELTRQVGVLTQFQSRSDVPNADELLYQPAGDLNVPVDPAGTTDTPAGISPAGGSDRISGSGSGEGLHLAEGTGPAAGITRSAGIWPGRSVLSIGTCVWLCGLLGLILYNIAGYIGLKRKVYDATRSDGNIYETDRISTAFVLGFVRPRIIIPVSLGRGQRDYILKHEQVHISRYDYLIKPIAYLVLAVHWFNPVVWVSYYLMAKDMEMSCDEAVLRQEEADIRQAYSMTLVHLYTCGSGLLSPLAFGEGSIGNMKARVKNVLNFRKTSRWTFILCSFLTVLFTAGFTTSQPQRLSVGQPAAENAISSEAEALTKSYYAAQDLRPYTMLQKSIFKKMIKNGWLDDLDNIENPVWNYESFTAYQALDQDLNAVPREDELYYCAFTADHNRQGYVVLSYTGSGIGRVRVAETTRSYDLTADLELIVGELKQTNIDLQTASASRIEIVDTAQHRSEEAILITDGDGNSHVYYFDHTGFTAQQSGSAKRPQTKRQESLSQEFAKYQPFGIRYDADQDAVYYNGERVKLFVDFMAEKEPDMAHAFELCFQDRDSDSNLCLEAYKGSDGSIAGIRTLDAGVADALLEVMDQADTGLSEFHQETDQTSEDYHFLTMDGTQMIESYGITARDMTKDNLTGEIGDWIDLCDRKVGVYATSVQTAEGYTTYVYYNGGGRYPWNLKVEENCIKVNLYRDTRFMTAHGYYLMSFTAPKEYSDIKLYLDDMEL